MPTSVTQRLDELSKQLEQLQKSAPLSEPFRLSDLVGRQIPTPIPIGATRQQGFAPSGPNLTFTGGLPHQPDNTGAVMHNALNFVFSLRKELEALKKKSKEQQGAQSSGRP